MARNFDREVKEEGEEGLTEGCTLGGLSMGGAKQKGCKLWGGGSIGLSLYGNNLLKWQNNRFRGLNLQQ